MTPVPDPFPEEASSGPSPQAISEEPAHSPSALPVPLAEAVSGSARQSVLVVDDTQTPRFLLSEHVRRLGHSVECASNGREALEMLRAGRFDLVLLDVVMPEMDGHAVLAQMQAERGLRDIPVIVVSGVDDLESVVRCIEQGAEDYLHKPANPTVLKARINASLEKKRLRDQERRLHAQLQANFDRLQELESLRDSLTHMVVHDLRTPLTSILAGLYNLRQTGPLTADQAECWEISVHGGEALVGLISDILDVNRAESGGAMALARSTPGAEGLVERAIRQVSRLARNRELRLESLLPPDLPLLWVDEDKIARVLVNLLGNAVKFTSEGGRVTVSASLALEPGYLLFRVADTGQGIPRADLERIFEKFAQVEENKVAAARSSGLGLAFCRMVVEAHGGRIWAESEPGKGSTFYFTLPAHRTS